MNKKSKTFRFHSVTLDKLEMLYAMEKKEAEKYNTVPKNMTEIIEDAISEYYCMKLDKNTGTDYLSRMNEMIQDAIRSQSALTDSSLNTSKQFSELAYETSMTILKYLRLDNSQIPASSNDAQKLVNDTRSIFEDPIKDKVLQKNMSGNWRNER